MSDDAVDYGSSSDESDQVPSRLPASARAESCILAHDLSVLHACRFRMRTFIAVGHLKARYPEEANNVALDIKTKLGASELALQR